MIFIVRVTTVIEAYRMAATPTLMADAMAVTGASDMEDMEELEELEDMVDMVEPEAITITMAVVM